MTGTESTPDLPQDRAAAYVLGALADDEAREFEALLARSSEARREVAEHREVMALLATSASGPAPAAGLRDRVLARLDRDRTRPLPALGRETAPVAPARRRTLVWAALAASLVAVVGLGAGARALRHELASVRSALAQNEQALADVQRRLAERETTLRSIFRPSVEMFQLTSTGDPDPRVQLFWDRERMRAMLHGTRLRELPHDRAYQLWFIRDGKAVPSVTFSPSPEGTVQIHDVEVPSDGTVSAAAITVEPSSGSPQPTSPIVIVGSLGKPTP